MTIGLCYWDSSLKSSAKQPGNGEARKGAWRAAMRLGLFEQAARLAAPLSEKERQSLEGERIALEIRYGIIDRNTLKGPDRFGRLDKALAATDRWRQTSMP